MNRITLTMGGADTQVSLIYPGEPDQRPIVETAVNHVVFFDVDTTKDFNFGHGSDVVTSITHTVVE